MSLRLRPETEEQIERRLSSGEYTSADDVVLQALRLLDERDQQQKESLVELRQKISIGLAELDRGEGADGEAVFEELLADLEREGEAA